MSRQDRRVFLHLVRCEAMEIRRRNALEAGEAYEAPAFSLSERKARAWAYIIRKEGDR